MVVSRSVVWGKLDGGLKLANGAFQVARVEKPCTRICGERCRLQARFTLGDFLGCKRLCLGPGRVSLLAQHGSEGSVRTGKIGLQRIASRSAFADSCNLPCCLRTVPSV